MSDPMVVYLTERAAARIQAKIDSGAYNSADHVVEAGLRLLDEQEQRLAWLKAELAIGEEQERRGEVFELTDERFEAIKQRAREDARAGKPIKDAVRP